MKKRKRPNYALRRKVAVFILIMIVLLPIIIINRVKILNLHAYVPYMKYSKVVDALFESDYSKDEVVDLMEYLKNNEKITEDTQNYILKLHSKGYNKNTINFVLKNLEKKEITSLLSKSHDKDFEKYITFDLFNYNHYKRYVEFQEEHDSLKLKDVVTRVELNLDKDYYEDTKKEKYPNSITCLVNKYRYLDEKYIPDDLVDMDNAYANNSDNQKRLRKEAYNWFTKMVDDANKVGIKFYAESAFRTYDYQETIYNSYVNAMGKIKTDEIAARPGYSDHQTGLAVDLANIWTLSEGMEEYEWVKKNAHKYGYIIRYEKDKEDVTGFGAETWHIRYVGKKAANYIYKNNITFDEYYINFIYKKK